MRPHSIPSIALVCTFSILLAACENDVPGGITGAAPSPSGVLLQKPGPASISVRSVFTPLATTSGTFSAAGMLNTSGTTSEVIHFGDEHTWHSQIVFTDAMGSFKLQNQGQYYGIDPVTVVGDGHWGVLSGTGAYSNLHGTGTLSMRVTFDENGYGDLSEEWDGTLLFDNRP